MTMMTMKKTMKRTKRRMETRYMPVMIHACVNPVHTRIPGADPVFSLLSSIHPYHTVSEHCRLQVFDMYVWAGIPTTAALICSVLSCFNARTERTMKQRGAPKRVRKEKRRTMVTRKRRVEMKKRRVAMRRRLEMKKRRVGTRTPRWTKRAATEETRWTWNSARHPHGAATSGVQLLGSVQTVVWSPRKMLTFLTVRATKLFGSMQFHVHTGSPGITASRSCE